MPSPNLKSLAGFKLTRASLKDPRVAMRAVIGALLAANLAAAVIAFKPFGGSADDLRREQEALSQQLSDIQKRVRYSAALTKKVDLAKHDGDKFLSEYFMSSRTITSTLAEELDKAAKDAGIKPQPASQTREDIEGSDTLKMVSITCGYEGTYANLKKFIEILDKSPRFLIIENMTVLSPQQQAGQVVTVALKLDAFYRELPGGAL